MDNKKLFKKLKKIEKNAILFDRTKDFYFNDIINRLNIYPEHIIDEFILNYKPGYFCDFLYSIKSELKHTSAKMELHTFKNIVPGKSEIALENRAGQNRMIEDIEFAIKDNAVFIGESPPGTGKSLAYLIPIVKNIHNNRAIISTNTKNLQMQLFFNDSEILKQFAHTPFTVCVIKGISNYLCYYKYENNKNNLNPLLRLAIEGFISMSLSGDLHFLKFNYKIDYNEISADNEFCLEKDCPFYSKCFFMNLRMQAQKADMIFTNHYLTLIDEQLNNKFFGKYSTIVFDESHNLENVITELFSYKFNFNYVINMLSYFRNRMNKEIRKIRRRNKKRDVYEFLSSSIMLINSIIDNLDLLKLNIKDKLLFDNQIRHPLLNTIFEENKNDIDNIKGLFFKVCANNKKAMDLIKNNYRMEKDLYHLFRYAYEKIQYFFDAFNIVMDASNEEYAFFYETDKNKNIIFNGVPIETGELFADLILKKDIPTLFISATLGISGNFSMFKKQIGINNVNRKLIEDVYETSFNWEKQMKIICINDMGNPNSKDFLENACKFIMKIREHNKRTLVLATSYEQISFIKNSIDMEHIYFQDKDNNFAALLDKYKSHYNAILVGTNKLWEGVDLPGELVERIIILKMPFAVPEDPVIKKRNEKLLQQGLNPFLHYSLPMAILKMKQGIGRLIRKRDDIGIVYILDERIIKKRYGKIIINSMFVKPIIKSFKSVLRGEL